MKFAPIHMIHKFSLLSSFIVTSVWQFLPKAFFFLEKKRWVDIPHAFYYICLMKHNSVSL